MSDLDLKEQHNVRTAMRYLRRRVGRRAALADALHFAPKTVQHVMDGSSGVSASMAIRVARLADVSVDDLLAGRFVPGACPRCGYLRDFADEPTRVDDVGLKLVR